MPRSNASSAAPTPTGKSATLATRRSGRNARAAKEAEGVALQEKIVTGGLLTEEEEANFAEFEINEEERIIPAFDYDDMNLLSVEEVAFAKELEAGSKLAESEESTKEQLQEALKSAAIAFREIASKMQQDRAESGKAPQQRLESVEATIRDITIRDLERLGFEEGSAEFELHVLTKAQEHKEKEAAKAKALCDELLAKAAAGSSGIASAAEQIAKAAAEKAAAEAKAAADARRKEAEAAAEAAEAAAALVEQQRMQTRKMTEAKENAIKEHEAKLLAEQEEAKQRAEEQLATAAAEKAAVEKQLADERAAKDAAIAAGIAAGIANAPPAAAAASGSTNTLVNPPKKKGTKRAAEKTPEQLAKAAAAAAKKLKKEQDAADTKAEEDEALADSVRRETEARVRKEMTNQTNISAQQGTTNASQQQQITSLEETAEAQQATIDRMKKQLGNLRAALANATGMEDEALEDIEFEGIEEEEEEESA